jgi:hypothetical protein
VRFDDRVRTVLAQPATDPHDRAVRWRQLVELAARTDPGGEGGLLQQAIEAIREDCRHVEERVRIAAALAIAPLAPPVELVAAFAADRLSVAAPVLAGARLTASEWKEVAQEASEECRGFISIMRSEERLSDSQPLASTGGPPGDQPKLIPSISEVVARIERIRSSRESGEAVPAPPQGANEAPRLFRWECNEAGEIDWVEGAPRGALVGHSIAQRTIAGGVDRAVERAFASRAPFHGGVLELAQDTPLGGTWAISGVPAFEPATGRFSGYRGMAERPGEIVGEPEPNDPENSMSLRELAHEIRTPLNAIIGFAEIIDGEYFGPAESRYRERAAEILAQARQLLSAVEDLDLSAKLRVPGHSETGQVHLGQLVERLMGGILESAAGSGVSVDAPRSIENAIAAVKPEIAERLVNRLCGAAIAASAPGERLRLLVDSHPHHCTVSISRPASLQAMDLSPDRNRRAGDSMTLPIRLVMGLARTAGGEIEASGQWLTLRLPRAEPKA